MRIVIDFKIRIPNSDSHCHVTDFESASNLFKIFQISNLANLMLMSTVMYDTTDHHAHADIDNRHHPIPTHPSPPHPHPHTHPLRIALPSAFRILLHPASRVRHLTELHYDRLHPICPTSDIADLRPFFLLLLHRPLNLTLCSSAYYIPFVLAQV